MSFEAARATISTKPIIGLTCRYSDSDDRLYLPAEYGRAIEAAGGSVLLIPQLPESARNIAPLLDGVVICGSGSDVDPARYNRTRHEKVETIHPDLDEISFRLLENAFADRKPILGICYGMQLLNVFLGGTLIQHIPDTVSSSLDHQNASARHLIQCEADSILGKWAAGPREIQVNSTHHQAIEELGRGLSVAARAPDDVIEAVEGELPGQFVVGVQWHPERIWKEEPLSRRIFAEFVQAAKDQSSLRFESRDAKLAI